MEEPAYTIMGGYVSLAAKLKGNYSNENCELSKLPASLFFMASIYKLGQLLSLQEN